MKMLSITRRAFILLAVVTAVALCAVVASAEVRLPSIFGKSMVLQREMPVPVWGSAEVGEKVTVTFAGQSKTATAGEDGRWRVTLDALKASDQGQTLTISGSNEIKLDDILVGEIWICSGQSNMEWPLKASTNAQQEVADSDHPTIRLFNVLGHTALPMPQDNCRGSWTACGPKTSGSFSGVGYFFGRRLNQELGVPVGLVGSNWGGTRIEPWISTDGFKSVPELSKLAEQTATFSSETKVNGRTPSAIYNAMIHPLAPFAMRGAIWYQGESNGNEGETYYQKKKALVASWRKVFENPDLGFYWVQLASFKKTSDKPEGGDGWAKLREAQRKALTIPHTGMAVITDIGQAGNIHPRNKQDVGWRLAQWALHQTYGKKDLVPAGPLYKGLKIDGDSIRLSFDYVGSGLMVGEKEGLAPTKEVKDGKLAHFAIAGADKKWFWAEAIIDGDVVVVRCDDVSNPVAVRYGYTINPASANLYNKEGIPASPFRTDDW